MNFVAPAYYAYMHGARWAEIFKWIPIFQLYAIPLAPLAAPARLPECVHVHRGSRETAARRTWTSVPSARTSMAATMTPLASTSMDGENVNLASNDECCKGGQLTDHSLLQNKTLQIASKNQASLDGVPFHLLINSRKAHHLKLNSS